MGVYDQAIAAAQRTLAFATASGDAVLQALANLRLGAASRSRATIVGRSTISGRPWPPLRGRGATSVSVGSCRCDLPCTPCRVPCRVRDVRRRLCLRGEGLRIAEAMAHPGSLMLASWGIGLLALYQGDLSSTLPRLERAVGICQDVDLRSGSPGWLRPWAWRTCWAGAVLTPCRCSCGRWNRPLHEMIDFQARCGLSLGAAQRLAGRLEDAHALAEHTLAHAREYQERSNQAYALRLLGDIAMRREPLESNKPKLTTGRPSLWPRHSACAHFRPIAIWVLARCMARSGRREEACHELSAAIDLYRAMDMTF